MKIIKLSNLLIVKSIVLLIGITMLSSCKNDIREVNALSAGDSIPDLTAKNFVYLRSDSGRIVAKLQSPRMIQFGGGGDPYMEFPDGFKIEFYNRLMQVESVLTADYGIQYDKRKLIKAQKNVVVINLIKNEQMNAEELIWDQRRKKIYSESKIKITQPTQILYGAGFESDENFRNYEVFKGSGDFEIDEGINQVNTTQTIKKGDETEDKSINKPSPKKVIEKQGRIIKKASPKKRIAKKPAKK